MSVDLAALVKRAFSTVGGAVQDSTRQVTYRKTGAQTYNPATGAQSATTTNYTVTAIFTSYSRKEKETDFQNSRRQAIEFGDQKVLISYADLPVSASDISLEDTILDGASAWRIIDHKVDPTGKALHTFQVRQS
jgi:hypothetical protein